MTLPERHRDRPTFGNIYVGEVDFGKRIQRFAPGPHGRAVDECNLLWNCDRAAVRVQVRCVLRTRVLEVTVVDGIPCQHTSLACNWLRGHDVGSWRALKAALAPCDTLVIASAVGRRLDHARIDMATRN